MPWEAGDPVVDPTAGQTLVQYAPTFGQHCWVVVAVMAKAGIDVILQLVASDGVTIRRALIIPVTAGFFVSPSLGPIQIGQNERLRVVNRNALPTIPGLEVQASLFYSP